MMNIRIRVLTVLLLVCFLLSEANGQQPVEPDQKAPYPSLRAALLSDTLAFRQNKMYIPAEHRALFCRFDDKLDKEKIPLRMRLGSLEEVNRKEAKPGYRLGTVAPKQ